MTGYLILIALCVVGANAIPKPAGQTKLPATRAGGEEGPVIATTAPHACMILVHRADLDGTGTAALGSGSIISTRHVVTAAHLVQGNVTRYQIGFIVNLTSRRLVEATFRLIHEDYDNTDFSSDIALIFLQGTTTFPAANIIPITDVETEPTEALRTVGFGFTEAGSTGASADPHEALQGVIACDLGEDIEPAATHFCAIDSGTPATFVCPGDNGAGCFSGDTVETNLLVGIASRILPGCAAAQQTAYTLVGPFAVWIRTVTGLTVPQVMAMYNNVHLIN